MDGLGVNVVYAFASWQALELQMLTRILLIPRSALYSGVYNRIGLVGRANGLTAQPTELQE
jgi:hypothetical protein